MNPQIEAVQQAAAILRAAFPGHATISVWDGSIDVSWFGPKTYRGATEWLQSVGVHQRHKNVHDTYTALSGVSEFDSNITFMTYPDQLPPCCRIVKKIERVPKTETKETGEFIEIEREVVECGPEQEHDANLLLEPKEVAS